MKRNLVGFFLICVAAQLSGAVSPTAYRTSRCAPGDAGPKPFEDISSQLSHNMAIFGTQGGIQEFTLAPSNQAVFYRNDASAIYAMDIDGDSQQYITDSQFPLSSVFDSRERFLLSQGEGWGYELRSNNWIHFLQAPQPVEHLFWNRDSLGRDWVYSLSTEKTETDTIYHFYRSAPGMQEGTEFCTVKNLEIATGHRYPYVFFYRTVPSSKGPLLSELDLDLRSCHVALQTDFLDPLVGPVVSMHRFDVLNSVAVQVDHPTKNLLWYRISQGCDYFDISKLRPTIPNERLPILSTWSKDTGFSLVFLNEAKKATLFSHRSFEDLRPRDVALTNDARQLIVSPLFNRERTRPLIRVGLERR